MNNTTLGQVRRYATVDILNARTISAYGSMIEVIAAPISVSSGHHSEACGSPSVRATMHSTLHAPRILLFGIQSSIIRNLAYIIVKAHS